MSNDKKPKLGRLPKDAKITKRPLMRPALPSPYAGAQSQKIVYVSTKSPFMSIVQRVEKLLRLSDKRLIQSATTIAQDRQYRKRRRGGGDGDDIEAIAEVAEEQKRNHKRRKMGAEGESAVGESAVREEVVVKGSGKAIPRVMELGVWFQQRAEQYAVRIVTGSTNSIDDVEYEKDDEEVKTGAERDEMDVDQAVNAEPGGEAVQKTFVSEARIRKVSVLEVHVSLR
ncbi:hypothetical protein M409DRAFT_71450 [Zasmidium cellare ATCC 36951]|uniref:Uncharacterized protein n=1 Tax=Zasmidium cellare ATCC 36951 TaxID=1080233 RepID=A0A6A6BZ09_ZASCE|nr:uncharacterized protein M409DRAFT_71450 [Zasmidium cellare ATCC 36951]KAF2158822.1 hypothetical protein M409DRAFT_71450 [Zasmidium cellare ATCC 36951]